MAQTQTTSPDKKLRTNPPLGALPESESVPTKALFLDPRNPRLTGEQYSVSEQEKILKRLWNEFNLSEITDSIFASQQFWRHEPLIAAREGGKLVVIEGNRRLGAVQLLLSPQ